MADSLPGFRAVQRSAIHSRKLRRVSADAERAYWRILLAGDPYGTMSCDPAYVASTALPGIACDIAAALDELDAAGLIVRWTVDGDEWLHLVGFDEHQLAEFRRKRAARKTPCPPLESDGTIPLRAGTMERVWGEGGTPPSNPDAKTPYLQGAPPYRTNRTKEPIEGIAKAILSESPKATADPEQVNRVFQHWKGLTWPGQGRAPSLSTKRKQRIKARMQQDGFTVDELCNALSGYAADPFWNGTEDGRKHMELAYRLADVENVERGLALYAQQQQRSGASLQQYDRPINA